ncbi:SWIM zinc finger family protein [Burkholderia ubonensis]|uniref:SWIM zinc finger family protein n=1 Tax=Burkholderia ubonensis TaxID=101571 RepID=UPI001E383CFB|nr:SWIM zinc finger family protein [Burkholderia ubonensis]
MRDRKDNPLGYTRARSRASQNSTRRRTPAHHCTVTHIAAPMQLTEQQVLALAPDSGSASNGKKLAQPKQWPLLGRNARAIWGECQGSGKNPYQVRVDLADFASKCSCPSFKFPCKHALGLLVLAANQPDAVAETDEPEWVASWLDKRADNAAKKEARASAKADAPVDEAAQQKRAEKRDQRVRDGLAALQVWLEDLVRNGLARLPAEGPGFWEQAAARLVDAQASGLAARVRALADLPGSRPDWPELLLAELGRLSLAVRAHERIEQLDPALQQQLRQLIGYSLREDEVLAHGDTQHDCWQVIGQHVDADERVRVQRSWLIGTRSGRHALLLQFAAGNQPFAASWLPGTAFEGELAFWPGAGSLRAMLKGVATPAAAPGAFPLARTHRQLLDAAASLLALNPWHERMATVLDACVPVFENGQWQVVGADGDALPLAGRDQWLWAAIAGGAPHAVAVEWDGQAVRPLGLYADGRYQVLTGVQ